MRNTLIGDNTVNQLFTLTLWRIRINCNDIVFNKGQIHALKSRSVYFCWALQSICKIRACSKSISDHVRVNTTNGSASSVGILKINIDAGCFEDHFTCWGWKRGIMKGCFLQLQQRGRCDKGSSFAGHYGTALVSPVDVYTKYAKCLWTACLGKLSWSTRILSCLTVMNCCSVCLMLV